MIAMTVSAMLRTAVAFTISSAVIVASFSDASSFAGGRDSADSDGSACAELRLRLRWRRGCGGVQSPAGCMHEPLQLGCMVASPVLVSDFDRSAWGSDCTRGHGAGQVGLLVLDRHTGASGMREWLTRKSTARGRSLVVNDTRFAARLTGHRAQRRRGQCLLLSLPEAAAGEAVECDALMHPGQKLKPGAIVRFAGEAERSSARCSTAILRAPAHPPAARRFHVTGRYAGRSSRPRAAAPIHQRPMNPPTGIAIDDLRVPPGLGGGADRRITLHAGNARRPGRSRRRAHGRHAPRRSTGRSPVRVEHVEDHVVDPEPYEINNAAAAAINVARQQHRRVIAVGTTTTRAPKTQRSGAEEPLRPVEPLRRSSFIPVSSSG